MLKLGALFQRGMFQREAVRTFVFIQTLAVMDRLISCVELFENLSARFAKDRSGSVRGYIPVLQYLTGQLVARARLLKPAKLSEQFDTRSWLKWPRFPKNARLGKGAIAGVVGFCLAFSVYSVNASLQDPATQRIIQDPQFYLGVEGGYGQAQLSSTGLNLITPNIPTTGIFGNQGVNGSVMFGAGNLVDFGAGISFRGELEYQKLGRPHFRAENCCSTTPISFFDRGEIETDSGFANLWLDIKIPDFERTKLFLGGGVGFANHSPTAGATAFSGSVNDAKFAYHLGGGFSHMINPAVEFLVAGRYRDLGKSALGLNGPSQDATSIRHAGFEARIGFRYKLEALVKRK